MKLAMYTAINSAEFSSMISTIDTLLVGEGN